MNKQITFRIKLEKPPPGVDFALQKGAGNNYEPVQKQISGNEDLIFECPVSCGGTREKETLPKLGGPFVQGPAGSKFIYIGVGTFAGKANSIWSRRIKVPLTGITWLVLDKAVMSENGVLEAAVPGTGKNGEPMCATVKPFEGWRIVPV